MNAPQFNLPLKPGRTTTEFWLVILTGLLSTGLAATQLLAVEWATLATVLLAALYNHHRGKLKLIQAQTEAEGIKTDFRLQEAEELAALRADRLVHAPTPPPEPPQRTASMIPHAAAKGLGELDPP